MSYQREYTIDLGLTGLTLDYRLWDTTGAYIAAAVPGALAERGATGCYAGLLTIPAAHRGGVDVLNHSGGAILASAAINPEESESAPADVWAYAARTLTSSGPISVSSPWAADGTLTLAEGAAYTAALGTRLDPLVLPSSAPDLTGRTVTCEIALAGHTAKITTTVTVSGPASAQVLQIGDLTSAQTAALDPGEAYRFTCWASAPPAADRWPVVSGPVTVEAMG